MGRSYPKLCGKDRIRHLCFLFFLWVLEVVRKNVRSTLVKYNRAELRDHLVGGKECLQLLGGAQDYDLDFISVRYCKARFRRFLFTRTKIGGERTGTGAKYG